MHNDILKSTTLKPCIFKPDSAKQEIFKPDILKPIWLSTKDVSNPKSFNQRFLNQIYPK